MPEAGSSWLAAYILVIVNVPFPVQPPLPVSVQVPEMVLPLAVPDRASVLPEGFPDCTAKQPPVDMVPMEVSDPSPLTSNEVPNEETVRLPPLTKVAFQVPLMLEFELFEPQPISVMPTNTTRAARNRCMRNPPEF